MAGALQDQSCRLLNIIAPRGHAKSTIAAGIFPIHHLVFGGEGPKFIVLVSKTQGHAIRLLDTIKAALNYSPNLHRLWGYHGESTAKRWSRQEILLDTGDYILCRGTGQMVRGLKQGDQRPTLIVLDDPEDENNTKTAEAMESNLKWLLQGLEPALDAMKGRLVVIGTPQHERSMVMVLKEMYGWKTYHYSAEHDPEKEIPLWEGMWPWQKLMEKRKAAASINRLSVYFREWLCKVLADEDQLFKETYWRDRYYDGHAVVSEEGEAFLQMTYPEERKIPINIFMGIDPATSLSESADYFAIVAVGVDKQNNRYVLPYIRSRLAPSNAIEVIQKEYAKLKAKRVNIETTAAQETFRDILRNMEGVYIPGLGIGHKPREKKKKRYMELLEPYFYKGKVWIKKDMQALIDELVMFPKGQHDDLLDALYLAFKGAYRATHEVVKPKTDLERFIEERESQESFWYA